MPFLLKTDYSLLIKQDLLNTVLDGRDYVRADAEAAALQEMQGYLRGVFDLGQIFIEVLPWHELQQYAAGAAVSSGSVKVGTGAAAVEVALLYVATGPSLGELPVQVAPGEPAAGAWEQRDPRAPLVKLYLIDMVLYHIHSAQNPRAIPQIRQDRYDTALRWCKDCRAGKVSPGLPLLPAFAPDGSENRESIRVRGGSAQSKMRNNY